MIKAPLSIVQQVIQAKSPPLTSTFSGVSIDSRELIPGNLFFAIQGPNFDGHNFASLAEQRGAVALVVERKLKGVSIPQLRVNNTRKALAQLASWWRGQFTVPVIGITGSCGKTTTKQMLSAILSKTGNVLASQGNQNNQLGVPLTLLRLEASHQYAVIEMGADRLGDISYLCDIANPNIGIITNIVSVHVDPDNPQRFAHIDAIFQEKTQLFDHLSRQDYAIINADDLYYSRWQQRLRIPQQLSFGMTPKADVYASDWQANAALQYRFQLHTPLGEIPIQLSSLGKHNIENALAAAAAAVSLGIDLATIQAGLAHVETVSKRLVSYLGINGAKVIDDSYNANIKSVAAVIEMLASYPGKRIIVLGDMCEVGDNSIAEHRKMGELARALGIDYFYAYGDNTRHSIAGFTEHAITAQGFHFTDHTALVNALRPQLTPETTVLVKGSRSMAMETIVNAIKRNDACYFG